MEHRTRPGHHWVEHHQDPASTGHDQDTAGTTLGHLRDTTGTPTTGTPLDTAGTPRDATDTTGTRLGHQPPGHHRDTTGHIATPPGHHETRPGHHWDMTGTPTAHDRDTTGPAMCTTETRNTTGTPLGHHRDTTETGPLHRRDTTGTPPRHHRDTTGTPPGHNRDSTKRLGHRIVHSPKMDASTNINRVRRRPQTWWLLGNNTGTPPRHTTARDTTATATPTAGTLPRHHWTFCNTTGTPPGNDQDTTGTTPAHRTRPDQHCDTETPQEHHRNIAGTPPGHHWDRTITPLRHHWNTTATPLGHNAAPPGHHYTTGTGTPPGHREEKRLGHRTVHSPKMDASTNTNRVRSRPQTWWLLGKNTFWDVCRARTSQNQVSRSTCCQYGQKQLKVLRTKTFRVLVVLVPPQISATF